MLAQAHPIIFLTAASVASPASASNHRPQENRSHERAQRTSDSSTAAWVEHLMATVCFFLHIINHNSEKV
jgi:hypothetical protein